MDFVRLSQARLFAGIPVEEIEKNLEAVPYRIKKFRSGMLIAQSGDIVDSIIIVLDGTVKGEMVDYAGRVIKIEDIPAPGALAPAFIFGSDNRFPVNVIAVSDGELLVIGKSDFLSLLMKNDRMLSNYLDMISNRSQFLSEKIKFLNFRTIKSKLAHFILQRVGSKGSQVSLGMTQNEMADYFGVARPSVARALGDMEEEGIIEAKGRWVRIIDRKRLMELTAD